MYKYETALLGVYIIENKKFIDDRGFFVESYNQAEFNSFNINTTFLQDNHSLSHPNVIRGLHFQSAPGQIKLVRCTRGRILDVAVDIDPQSVTFRQWISVELTPENNKMLYIPGKYAHGFAVLDGPAEVQYKCSSLYDATLEKTIKYDDPDLAIKWQIANPTVSARDKSAPSLQEYINSLSSI